MDARQIEANLKTLFERSDIVQGKRTLVFWYDPDAEFEEAFSELELPDGIQKIELADIPFTVKHRLLVECPDTSFLLYAPFPEPQARENWLLDLQKQAELFTADRAALLFRQLGLHDRSLQKFLREHLTFFNNKKRSEALQTIGVPFESNEMDLRLAMMCATCGLKAANADQLLRKVLMAGLNEEKNSLWTELTKHFSTEEFWDLYQRHLGFQAEAPSLRELFIRLALTHLNQDLRAALPNHLHGKLIDPPTRAYVFVDGWIRHSNDSHAWAELTKQLAPDLGIEELAESLHPSEYDQVETFEEFDQALIRHVTSELQQPDVSTGSLKEWISNRKVLFWHDRYADHYEALEAATSFQEHLQDFPKQLPDTADALFNSYAKTQYRIDQHYRHYLSAADRVGGEVLKPLTETIESAYTHAYLEPLGDAWSQSLEALDNRWGNLGVRKQWWFYEQHVAPVLDRNDREKVFVIISDALRYEIADELRESLVEDLRGEAALTPLLGILPSITMLGMAALLPGAQQTLELEDRPDVLVSGQSSSGTTNRTAILNTAGVSGTTLGATELLAMGRDEGRQAVQPHRVIYIYQNRIDAIGDKAASERGVFDACSKAIEEISQVVRKIANQLNGTNILVTSDHGFLYQRQPLAQHDKVKPPTGEVIDSGRRHALGRNLRNEDGTLSFNLPYLQPEGLTAQAPRGTLRYAIQGAGAQYVHGGASLQEVCVPLLKYKHVRSTKGDEGPSRKVGVRVNASSRKITNNHFTLRLVQEEPIGERVKSRKVIVRFEDEQGNKVSNEYPLNLDSAAPQATDRDYIARLTIASTNLDRDKPYYLLVVDAEDDLAVLREAWQINLAFTDDFGDF